VALANDVAFQAGFDGVLRAFGLFDGTLLWSYDLGSSVSGGIAVVGDLVVLGAATPVFAPFIKEGSQVWAFRLKSPPIQAATPEPATPVPATPEPEPTMSVPATPEPTEPAATETPEPPASPEPSA
jgi:hypothetical protein